MLMSNNAFRLFSLFIVFVLFQNQTIYAEDKQKISIEDLGFISGTWEGVLFGAQAEEFWLSPRAGVMTGVFQLSFEKGGALLEFFIIEETSEGIFMRWKHYNSDYSAHEETPTILKLSNLIENKAVFDMIEKDEELPDRFIFERIDDEHLTILLGNTTPEGEFIEEGSIEAAYSLKKRN